MVHGCCGSRLLRSQMIVSMASLGGGAAENVAASGKSVNMGELGRIAERIGEVELSILANKTQFDQEISDQLSLPMTRAGTHFETESGESLRAALQQRRHDEVA